MSDVTRVIHRAHQMLDLIKYLSKLDFMHGGWIITISRYKKPRTVKQNSRYFALLGAVAQTTGMTKGEIEEEFRKMFLPTEQFKFGPVTVDRPKVPKELNTKEFAEYYDQCVTFSSEFFGVWMDERGYLLPGEGGIRETQSGQTSRGQAEAQASE